jgi:thymidine phosphorylase
VASIENRKIARLAKLAGAPAAKAAGVEMHVRLGDVVATGQPVCTVHAETPGELDYAIEYAASTEDIVRIDPR